MRRLRIGMVKILKSSLVIFKTFSYFYSKQHFRKIIMTDITTTLSGLVTSRNTWTQDTCLEILFLSFAFLKDYKIGKYKYKGAGNP
jgi:hypothetical protein